MISEWQSIALSLRLAALVTVLLLVIATPLAWWLARSRHPLKPVVEALTALPLVLPPTVLGFYLLILLNPQSPIGAFWREWTGGSLTFSFSGLVVASIIYSLPFAVQPLQTAFAGVGQGQLEAAASLGAAPLDRFIHIAIPVSIRGYITAAVLSFSHTLGEFGIVLMMGGSIPGETRVVSIALFEAVETLDYNTAHALSAGLILFAFVTLLAVFALNRRFPVHVR
ncbi:molybdate ABC transporter permease subunit [Maricaulis sp.]|uniref:molybdate ABC transporter permease subunit n=1 Tax=Maricaulis sp. TaxID=1486257 RepID=UPI002635CE28|nr:molybdate ABC transporter permease subunit [Maricaulis sp.]